MGRDRDPFDRTLEALRQRLSQRAYLQGAALPVNALANELGVSSTPVREALAHLAGEGLVVRTTAGYRGVVRDRQGLAHLYGLAGVLTEAVLDQPMGDGAAAPVSFAEALSVRGAGPMREALSQVTAQLAPYDEAERAVLGESDLAALNGAVLAENSAGTLAVLARRYYRRRARKAGDILHRALDGA